MQVLTAPSRPPFHLFCHNVSSRRRGLRICRRHTGASVLQHPLTWTNPLARVFVSDSRRFAAALSRRVRAGTRSPAFCLHALIYSCNKRACAGVTLLACHLWGCCMQSGGSSLHRLASECGQAGTLRVTAGYICCPAQAPPLHQTPTFNRDRNRAAGNRASCE